jgi:hypothetical protein
MLYFCPTDQPNTMDLRKATKQAKIAKKKGKLQSIFGSLLAGAQSKRLFSTY